MASAARRRAIERLQRLADAALDDETLRLEAFDVLGRVLPVDGWSWATCDPESQLAVSALKDHPLEARMLALLQAEEDTSEINRRAAMVASRTPAAALSAETGGDLHRSARWRKHLVHQDISDELRVIFADRTGCWGYLDFYVCGGRRYTDDDLDLARVTARLLTTALRRASAAGPASASLAAGSPAGAPREPAVLIVDRRLRLVARTGPADEWLPLLRSGAGDPLPCAVIAATAHSLAAAHDRPTLVRQRATDNGWASVRASRLDTGDVAVTIDHSRPSEVLGYLAHASALTAREQQILALLHRGGDTRAIATALVIAESTAQDHVKNILSKMGHTSRRALFASLSPYGLTGLSALGSLALRREADAGQRGPSRPSSD